MMRILGAVALAAVLGACTSVKMVQRDGCWIKRTEKIFGRVQEQVGPCMRPQPQWAQERLTRVVQECLAQTDYRWQGRAIEAFSRGVPYPAQPPPQETIDTCMEQARAGLLNENERLKEQLGDLKEQLGQVSTERDTLRSDSRQERDQLRASHDRIADHLGEAAKRPAGTAYASSTSSSDGRATNESGATLASESGSTSAGAPPTTAVNAAAPAPIAPLVRALAEEDAVAPSFGPERAREPAASPPAAKRSRPVAARARPSKGTTRAARAPTCEPSPACVTPPTAAEAGTPAAASP